MKAHAWMIPLLVLELALAGLVLLGGEPLHATAVSSGEVAP